MFMCTSSNHDTYSSFLGKDGRGHIEYSWSVYYMQDHCRCLSCCTSLLFSSLEGVSLALESFHIYADAKVHTYVCTLHLWQFIHFNGLPYMRKLHKRSAWPFFLNCAAPKWTLPLARYFGVQLRVNGTAAHLQKRCPFIMHFGIARDFARIPTMHKCEPSLK